MIFTMIVSFLLFCLCCNTVAAQMIWNSRLLSDVIVKSGYHEHETFEVSIREKNLTGFSGCIYDSIIIDWSTNVSIIDEIHVGVYIDGHHEIAIGALLQAEVPILQSKKTSVIKCIINEDHCKPSVGNIMAMTKGDPIISVYFNEDTNEPLLSSSGLLLSALSINPPLIGRAVGTWINSKTLQIGVDQAYLASVVEAHTTGPSGSISITPKFYNEPVKNYDGDKGGDSIVNGIETINDTVGDTVRMKGHLVIRPTAHGITKIFLINATSLSAISSVLSYDVKLCGEHIVPPLIVQQRRDSENRIMDGIKRKRPPTAAIHMKGVLSVTGKDSIKIPHDAVPAMAKGTWSLSFWIRLLDKPTGGFRALFYKGDGSTQRTPSAWLLPHANRVALRASTETNYDVGSDTVLDISANQKNLMTFVFNNSTDRNDASISASDTLPLNQTGLTVNGKSFSKPNNDASLDQDIKYSITSYVNGQLDIYMKYSAIVQGNDCPLHLFKDISHDGPKAFVSDLMIWDNALLAHEVQALYSAGQKDIQASGIDEVLNLFDGRLGVDSPKTPESQTVHSSGSNMIAQQLLEQGRTAQASCLSPIIRLDLYAEAASQGSAEALYLWGMLIAYKAEAADVSCGFDFSSSKTTRGVKGITDQGRAIVAFISAADRGYTKALIPLALSLLTGVGIEPLLVSKTVNGGKALIPAEWEVPLPPSEIAGPKGSISSTSTLHSRLVEALSRMLRSCNEEEASGIWKEKFPLGRSVLCLPLTTSDQGTGSAKSDEVSRLALGMLHLASALGGGSEADAILAHRYQHGIGLSRDIETAAQYALRAAAVSSEAFHRVGGQPIMESDRIDDNTEREVAKGNSGNDDELIQHQIVRADEGNVVAMVATGDLYYYGARGLPRDQIRALHYYSQGAAVHDPMALCGAAAMHLKGEGTPQKNVSLAVDLYEEAATLGSVKALNGLGYIYFYGESLPKNETKAFQYFLSAAEASVDGDSLTNAAHCLLHGIGVQKNQSFAVDLYKSAATKFGSFGAVSALGKIYMDGQGVSRSPSTAMLYLNAAVQIGPWSGWLRRGLDSYLAGLQSKTPAQLFAMSLMCYLQAGELGYEVSQANAAFIIRRKLSSEPQPIEDHQLVFGGQSYLKDFSLWDSLQYRELYLSASQNKDSFVMIGNLLYKRAGLNDPTKKLKYSPQSTWQYLNCSYFHMLSVNFLGGENKQGQNSGNDIADYKCIQDDNIKSSEVDDPLVCKDPNLVYKRNVFVERHTVRDLSASLWWYSKASHAGSPLGSIYVGLMNHFGIGVPSNRYRASRYYQYALNQSNGESQMVYLTHMLQWWTDTAHSYYLLQPIAISLEWIINYVYALERIEQSSNKLEPKLRASSE